MRLVAAVAPLVFARVPLRAWVPDGGPVRPVVALRLLSGIGWMVAAFFGGQFVVGRLRGVRGSFRV